MDTNRGAPQAGEGRLQALLRSVSDTIVVLDPDGTILYISPAAEVAWGRAIADLLGSNALDRVHPEDLIAAGQLFAASCEQPSRTFVKELRLRHESEGWRDFEVILRNLVGDPAVGGIVATCRDITQRKSFERKLEQLAFTDPLTGLANRALFLERLHQAVERAEQHGRPMAVLFIDLDNFKIVNDSLGHAAGDKVLIMVAERLRACLRNECTIARLGGDEFTIIAEELSDTQAATSIAHRVSKALQAPLQIEGRSVIVGGSIGLVVSTPGVDPAELLLRKADVAMYQAKAGGRGRISVFDASQRADSLGRLELESDLHQALDRGQLRVYYQPIVSLADGWEIRAAEALVRWEHPQRGLLMPADFIPMAEETGLLVRIGQWVLEQGCQQVRHWQQQIAPRRLTLAVNLSAHQLDHRDLVPTVLTTVRESGLDPRRLSLEITESMVMRDIQGTVARLAALREQGIQFAIDDFGTGYSSLSYLKHFPVNTLKMDRLFVADVDSDAYNNALMRSVIALAAPLGLRVTAEGIETQAEADTLRALGCYGGQGYLFGRPQPAAEFGELLQARSLPHAA